MTWDKDWDKNKDKDKDKDKECKCCLEIEKSIVVIICGELDIDKLKDCLKTVADKAGLE